MSDVLGMIVAIFYIYQIFIHTFKDVNSQSVEHINFLLIVIFRIVYLVSKSNLKLFPELLLLSHFSFP